ncbi:MAG: hypothetical protein LBQ47_03930, partial [Endomicrobium sp.]|nr:hypothetical protein [Endomicrobium sp.]
MLIFKKNPVIPGIIKFFLISVAAHAIAFGALFPGGHKSSSALSAAVQQPIEVSLIQENAVSKEKDMQCDAVYENPEKIVKPDVKTQEKLNAAEEIQNKDLVAMREKMQQQSAAGPESSQEMDCCKPGARSGGISAQQYNADAQGLKITRAPKPFYPQESRKNKERGQVIVAVSVL